MFETHDEGQFSDADETEIPYVNFHNFFILNKLYFVNLQVHKDEYFILLFFLLYFVLLKYIYLEFYKMTYVN